MSDLYADIGWKSILHEGEELCGDHVEVIETDGNTQVVVLADGLSSGVKACILSTLTSKIISTMMANGLPLEECVAAIADALPVDSEKGVAYSTFSIMRITDSREAELIQFDNPSIILLRGCNQTSYPREELMIGGKRIVKSTLRLREGDVFILMSDGCLNASASNTYNYNWSSSDIADYMKIFVPVGYTAKTLATMLVDECFRKYGEHPRDDATACVVCIRPRAVVNLMFGPPKSAEKDQEMMERFFRSPGKHIVCGGTSAKIAARYLGKEIKPLVSRIPTDIPPMSAIEGVDLVTEGVLTMHRALEYVADNAADNARYAEWSTGRDGACRIARALIEEASDIHLYLGSAVNEAYASLDLPSSINPKNSIIRDLRAALDKLGKRVTLHRY